LLTVLLCHLTHDWQAACRPSARRDADAFAANVLPIVRQIQAA
jgi:hypothetical protein